LRMKDCSSFSTRSKAIWYASSTSSCTKDIHKALRIVRQLPHLARMLDCHYG
jgi:hypothetical protein